MITKNNRDLFKGLAAHLVITLTLGFIIYSFVGILISFLFCSGMLWYLFEEDFELIPKDYVASIVRYDNSPLEVRTSSYFWKQFGLRKIHKLYDATIDKSVQQLTGLYTKDGKEVACKFQIFTRIVDPLKLESGLGFDNFEEELESYRENQYEEFVRGVTLDRLETSDHDDLQKQAEKIVQHHAEYGIEVTTKDIGGGERIPEIEVFDIEPKLAKVREDVQQEKFKQEVEEVKRKQFFNRVLKIYFQSVCRFSNETEDELLTKARNLLPNEDEDVILKKAVKMAEKSVPDKNERKRLYDEALAAQQLNQGMRTQSNVNYGGLSGNPNILLGAPGTK